MSIFKLTAGLSDELMRKIRLYWWGVENGKRKPH
uniref:Biopterin-dependent aromatic amino acid hydroxylase family profile domain-containing protein n=1 Tax=Arundo donax TaxID=35708 RepID=A0A0A9G1T6_ARUDO